MIPGGTEAPLAFLVTVDGMSVSFTRQSTISLLSWSVMRNVARAQGRSSSGTCCSTLAEAVAKIRVGNLELESIFGFHATKSLCTACLILCSSKDLLTF